MLLLVFLLQAEFICLFASFNYMSNNANEEAGRTSTCEVLLSVRSTALKPDQSSRQRIVLLGCVGRRRGCRGGRAKKKHKHLSDTGAEIPVVIVRHLRLHSSLHGSCGEIRRSVLHPVELQQQFVPCFFTANIRGGFVQKTDESEAVLRENGVDIACITETWLKQTIPSELINIPGYVVYRSVPRNDHIRFFFGQCAAFCEY